MTDNERTELERWIHERVMGKCWHEWGDPAITGFKVKLTCSKCGIRKYRSHIIPIPPYTTSLDAIRPVELKVIEMGYFEHLCYATQPDTWRPEFDRPDGLLLAMADALTRARACRAAYEARMRGDDYDSPQAAYRAMKEQK